MSKRNKKSIQKNKLTKYLENSPSCNSSVTQRADCLDLSDFYQACLFDEISANNAIDTGIQGASNVKNGAGNDISGGNALNNNDKTTEEKLSKRTNENIFDISIASDGSIEAANKDSQNPREDKCSSLECLKEVCTCNISNYSCIGSFIMSTIPISSAPI